jgi:hypothetical protein
MNILKTACWLGTFSVNVFPQPTEKQKRMVDHLNPLKHNDPYRSRTAPLTSKRCILYIFIQQI